MCGAIDLSRNNLDRAKSPYLLQHADNPVHWQEWSQSVIEAARQHERPLFVSVGYSTCHWCHVMAHEAFSDPEIAAYLNEHFVPVKVDREERPDVDQYLMSFLVASTGQGGWPLNAFVAPDLTPFFALTYMPVQPRYGMPGFKEVLEKLRAFYHEKKERLQDFDPRASVSGTELRVKDGGAPTEDRALHAIRTALANRYDREHGGFGNAQKFPPHCALLYMLHDVAVAREIAQRAAFSGGAAGVEAPKSAAESDPETRTIVAHTLSAMQLGGLHDHLQGGIFRYCVDRQWTIPHFEKMLYDQALALWYYSVAFRELGTESYKATALGIVTCLEETFREDGLFVAAHDADTDGVEGGSYIWRNDELAELLTEEELTALESAFDVKPAGNFEGYTHLVRRCEEAELSASTRRTLAGALERMRAGRAQRRQPAVDRKIVTSWNALAGIAYIVAGRWLVSQKLIDDGLALFDTLWKRHWNGERVLHSTLDGRGDSQTEFLSDYAAMALFASYCYEESGGYLDEMELLLGRMQHFSDGEVWLESYNSDFHPIPADSFDSPLPSTVGLARMARLRAALIRAEEPTEQPFHAPTASDFANLAALASRGYLHVVESPQRVPWSELPHHSLQRRGEHPQECFMGVCRPLSPEGGSR